MAESQAFLGTGWSFPPRFSQGGAELVMVRGEADIQQSLHILLTTEMGERLFRKDYGSDLSGLQFESTDRKLFSTVENIVKKAIRKYETRIELEQVEITESETIVGKLLIEIEYRVRTTNSRYNLTFPFYLNEAIQPPDQIN